MTSLPNKLPSIEEPTAFYLGKLQDGLSLDPLTGYSRQIIPFFAAHPTARLTLLTKSADVGNLLDLDHQGHAILSWTANPRTVVEMFEKTRRRWKNGSRRWKPHREPAIPFGQWPCRSPRFPVGRRSMASCSPTSCLASDSSESRSARSARIPRQCGLPSSHSAGITSSPYNSTSVAAERQTAAIVSPKDSEKRSTASSASDSRKKCRCRSGAVPGRTVYVRRARYGRKHGTMQLCFVSLDDAENQCGQIFPSSISASAVPNPRSGERKHTAYFASNLVACP